MALVELLMPKLGESVTEATILEWLKNEGDMIAEEESVLRIATDKVDSEVPSPYSGKITKILFQTDDVVAILTPIALIETEPSLAAANSTATDNKQHTPPPAIAQTLPTQQAQLLTATITTTDNNNGSGKFYSPLVKSMAAQEGISLAELDQIVGSGLDQRVTKADMQQYIAQRHQLPAPQVQQTQVSTAQPKTATPPPAPKAPPAIVLGSGDELVEMDRMRRLIADHMVMSKQVSPHVTSFIEVDVTNMVQWRNRIKDAFKKREGENITFTPIFIEAVAKALKKYPYVNASVDGTHVVLRKNINIGMAAATDNGNLIVPVLRNADHKNLVGLTKEVNDLAQRARIGKLKADDTQGGTFTLSNVGTFGSLMGTPIINQPQVAILATGTIKKKPVVLETPAGDVIAIRQMMFMSLSYDHRIVDGALGGRFLKEVADLLEAFDAKRDI